MLSAGGDLVFVQDWLGHRNMLADLGGARLWRIDRSADYGPLDGVARQTLNTKLVADNWDDMLRVAGTLVSCKVPASEIIRALQAGGRLTTLARAISEAGRATKTIHLLGSQPRTCEKLL
jgi:TnpA family transposase